MDNYADRKPELTKLRKELNCNHNAIFIMAGKAFGITSFLKEKAQVYFGDQGFLSFYVNATSKQNLAENILSTIIKNADLYTALQECMDASYGTKNRRDIMQDVPYIGNTISALLTSKILIAIVYGELCIRDRRSINGLFSHVISATCHNYRSCTESL